MHDWNLPEFIHIKVIYKTISHKRWQCEFMCSLRAGKILASCSRYTHFHFPRRALLSNRTSIRTSNNQYNISNVWTFISRIFKRKVMGIIKYTYYSYFAAYTNTLFHHRQQWHDKKRPRAHIHRTPYNMLRFNFKICGPRFE